MRKCIEDVTALQLRLKKIVGQLTGVLSESDLNIENMTNKSRGETAYTLIDCDTLPSEEIFEKLRAIDGVSRVRVIYY